MEKTKKTQKKIVVKKEVIEAEVKTIAKPVMKNKNEKKAMRKVLKGTVVSTKMQNTIIVAIKRKVAHKLYGKLIKVTKRIKADSNGMEVKEGDTVVIEQTRPISKSKNFKLIKKEEVK